MDQYLPQNTQKWVDSQLESLGYSVHKLLQGGSSSDGTPFHNAAYLQLRALIRDHIESRNEPELEECVKPTGGWGWEPSRTDFESQEMDIYNEGADVTANLDDIAIKVESDE